MHSINTKQLKELLTLAFNLGIGMSDLDTIFQTVETKKNGDLSIRARYEYLSDLTKSDIGTDNLDSLQFFELELYKVLAENDCALALEVPQYILDVIFERESRNNYDIIYPTSFAPNNLMTVRVNTPFYEVEYREYSPTVAGGKMSMGVQWKRK